jgi:hypothetical protein
MLWFEWSLKMQASFSNFVYAGLPGGTQRPSPRFLSPNAATSHGCLTLYFWQHRKTGGLPFILSKKRVYKSEQKIRFQEVIDGKLTYKYD